MQPKQVGIEKIKYESDLAVHDRMKFVDYCCLSLMTKRQPPSIGCACIRRPLHKSTVCRVVEADVVVDVECQPPRVRDAHPGSGLSVPVPMTLIAVAVVDEIEGVESHTLSPTSSRIGCRAANTETVGSGRRGGRCDDVDDDTTSADRQG